MNHGLAEASFARNDGGGCPTRALALEAFVGTTRLTTSFTRFTFFAEGPIAALRFALEGLSAVVYRNYANHGRKAADS
jgi:hypothetical protein